METPDGQRQSNDEELNVPNIFGQKASARFHRHWDFCMHVPNAVQGTSHVQEYNLHWRWTDVDEETK